jgi:excisionase family DNA binding protein
MELATVAPPLLSVHQAAEYLGIHHETLRRWCREGRITFHDFGGSGYKFDIVDLDAWIASRRRPAKESAHPDSAETEQPEI